MNIAQSSLIPREEQIRISKAAKGGSWYSDDYTPYCGQEQVKCSSPRMVRMTYGFRCPDCGNLIGWDFMRLDESPIK